MKKIMPFFLLILVISACNQSKDFAEVDTSVSKGDGSALQAMPVEIPADFGFSIQFGVGKKNEINTFHGTVTKDLVADGTATIESKLTPEEMSTIYQKMTEITIMETKSFTPEPINGSICVQEPYEEDEWRITINGETIVHAFSGTYCDPTPDATQLLELRNYVFRIIKSKEEYHGLPASTGGYE